MSSHVTFDTVPSSFQESITIPLAQLFVRRQKFSDKEPEYWAGTNGSSIWMVSAETYAHLLSALDRADIEPEPERVCEWQSEDVASSVWETACDNICDFHGWVYPAPTDNGFRLCPFCGGKLVLKGGER